MNTTSYTVMDTNATAANMDNTSPTRELPSRMDLSNTSTHTVHSNRDHVTVTQHTMLPMGIPISQIDLCQDESSIPMISSPVPNQHTSTLSSILVTQMITNVFQLIEAIHNMPRILVHQTIIDEPAYPSNASPNVPMILLIMQDLQYKIAIRAITRIQTNYQAYT